MSVLDILLGLDASLQMGTTKFLKLGEISLTASKDNFIIRFTKASLQNNRWKYKNEIRKS